jgi:tRNA pseudouridine55 synthase
VAPEGPSGLLVLDKPVGPTSHDVVAIVRRRLAERRVGHGGTLDPPASGVLLVAVGRSTRLLRYVLDLEKRYEAEIVLGTATSTLDDTGEVTGTTDMSGVTLEEVRAAASGFIGEIEQIPPMVSAVKVNGRRLHELAREGVEIERAPRRVRITELEIDPTAEEGVFRISMCCSSGTYVRSLAADLGSALGGLAHLRRLRRSAIGPFLAEGALAPDEVTRELLRPSAEVVAHLRSITVDDDLSALIATGRVLERRQVPMPGEGPWAVLDEAGELLAVYEATTAERAKPAVVLVTPG